MRATRPEAASQDTTVYDALHQLTLADARWRASLAANFEITWRQLLALEHLHQSGELTVGELRARLHASPAGTSGLVAGLERRHYLTRHPGRGARGKRLVRPNPQVIARLIDACEPLASTIEDLARALPPPSRDQLRAFVMAVAEAVDREAGRLAAEVDERRRLALASREPPRWG